MGIELEVLDGADPTTVLGSVTRAKGRRWQHDLNRAGSGSLQTHRTNPANSLLVEGNIVRCILDGVARFAWVIDSADQDTRASDPAAELRSVTGRGALSLFSRARLLPYSGIDRKSCNVRTFGWMAPERSTTLWSPGVEIKRQDDTTFGQWEYTDGGGVLRQAPVGWPDPLAWWVWVQAQGALGDPDNPPQPVGYGIFAGSFILTEQTPVAFFVTADDGYELWVNGCLVAQETTAFMWAETRRHDVLLEPGNVYVRIRGTTIEREHAEFNVAGILFAALATGEGGAQLGTVLLRSEAASFVQVGYPATEPGMTPGAILLIGAAEAQARHSSLLAGITFDFDEFTDSNGADWEVELNIGWPAPDTSMEKVIETLVEQAIDIELGPDLVLHVYNRGTLTRDLTYSAVYTGANTQSIHHSRQRVVVNAAFIRKQDGSLTEAIDGPSEAAHGRYESYLSLASSPSDESAAMVGDVILADFSDRAVNVAWVPLVDDTGTRPLADVRVGDDVLVTGMDSDVPEITRVLTIAVSDADDEASGEEPDGSVVFAASGFQAQPEGS